MIHRVCDMLVDSMSSRDYFDDSMSLWCVDSLSLWFTTHWVRGRSKESMSSREYADDSLRLWYVDNLLSSWYINDSMSLWHDDSASLWYIDELDEFVWLCRRLIDFVMRQQRIEFVTCRHLMKFAWYVHSLRMSDVSTIHCVCDRSTTRWVRDLISIRHPDSFLCIRPKYRI